MEFIIAEEIEIANEENMLALIMERRRLQLRTRNDLDIGALHTPEASTWQHLYRNGCDEALINVIGLNRHGFETLLTTFSKYYVVRYHLGKGGRPSKVPKSQALGMVLQFYASSVELKTIAQLHGVRKDLASRILAKGELALEKTLKEERQAFILWPSKQLQSDWAYRIKAKYPAVKKSFGFVDGKNYKVQEPREIDLQNALYNGWLHSALITGVLCFGVDGTIIWAKHNCVGSWNDGDMSRELQEKLLDPDYMLEGHGIVADTAFPVGKELLGLIITPLKDGDLERAHPMAQQQLQLISSSITSLRQACEWGVGSIEKAWRQLLLPLPFNPETRRRRLSNIFRLWNYRVRTTKISQIRTYFEL